MLNPKLVQYNAFGERTFEDGAGNISSIIDHMLRVTTKVTEHYAGDIVYIIDALRKAVEESPRAMFARLLVFRESGVDSYELKESDGGALVLAMERESPFCGIQYWTLVFNPETQKVKFERVCIL